MAGVSSQLPPGFRFHPTDEELVMHYLCRKCASQSIPVQIIAEIDLYKYAPWELPELALYGEKEWYFFSPRERKYPNGSRPNRAAGSGYWKATGADKPIGRPNVVAIKKALVFYSGKAPRGEKTNWIMHEYRLAHIDRSPRNNNYSLRLDDWVLCRLYNKKGATGKQQQVSSRKMTVAKELTSGDGTKPVMLTSAHQFSPAIYDDFAYPDASDSIPRQNRGLSCSEHILSPEVESMKLKLAEWEKATLHLSFNFIDATEPVGGGGAVELMDPQFRNIYQTEPVSNMFGYISNI